MSDTRVVSSRDLVRQESIQFIRAQTLTLTLIEARPNTKMYVFFGDEDVTHLCFPKVNLWQATTSYNINDTVKWNGIYYRVTTAGISGSNSPSHTDGSSSNGTTTLLALVNVDIVTDSIGQVVIDFNIPGGTFNVGNHDVMISDTNNLTLLNTSGSTYGSAETTFSANGIVEVYQTVQTTITTVTRSVPVQSDPLAQSFFTYGVTGGMFLSSVDVYFQTKDTTLPVRCEIRKLENGYPSKLDANNLNLVSIVSAGNVNISDDSSVATKFVFSPPLYLNEDSDYCFVLRSNSNNYNVFTSRMGENSLEDGRKIFENPYTGSVFKSENNITWTAEQFEDIKFTINKAEFDTNSNGILEFAAVVPPLAAKGSQFSTISGSNIITYTHPQEHGLELGSKFNVITRTDDLYVNASFNGIPYSEFNNNHTVTSVLDRNTIEFQVSTDATSTGELSNSTIVTYISVLSEGTNYSSADTVTFTGGGGSNAAATLNVVDGKIKGVIITNSGTGYTSSPTVSINTTTGTGASLQASVTPMFTVTTNKPMTGFIPQINTMNFGTSSTVNTLNTTIGNYSGGNLVTYTAGRNIEFIQNYPYANIGQNSLIASTFNEVAEMAGSKSALVTVELSTDNPNVSPIIDLNNKPVLKAYSTRINNQSGETLTSTNTSGSVTGITVTSAGTGYTVNPVATISAPDYPWGIQATANVVRSGTTIGSFTITEDGSGYINPPIVTITRGVGDTTGIGGAGQAVLSDFNTELLATDGQAKAKYITRKTSLQIVSSGVRIYSVISAIQGASVDWYIRTSLSTSAQNHEQLTWRRLSCDTERNRSSSMDQFLEYEFYLDNVPSFDTYDLKCVMLAQDPTKAPIVKSYRVIVIA